MYSINTMVQSHLFRLRMVLLFSLLLVGNSFASATTGSSSCDSLKETCPSSTECGVYLAQSTIPGAGMGIFAGRNYKQNEFILDGDIVIPLVDMNWHNGWDKFVFLWNDYVWSTEFAGMRDRKSVV